MNTKSQAVRKTGNWLVKLMQWPPTFALFLWTLICGYTEEMLFQSSRKAELLVGFLLLGMGIYGIQVPVIIILVVGVLFLFVAVTPQSFKNTLDEDGYEEDGHEEEC